MIECYRIVQKHLAKRAFDGEGARLYGGRWNSKGTRMIYTSSSLALASMELLIHLESSDVLAGRYCYMKVLLPNEFCQKMPGSSLPKKWHEDPPPAATQALGDRWIQGQTSLALQVPSALVPAEGNLLINPAHPDFSSLKISPARSFAFSPRLIKRLLP
jgi:RES domain-containing protein